MVLIHQRYGVNWMGYDIDFEKKHDVHLSHCGDLTSLIGPVARDWFGGSCLLWGALTALRSHADSAN